ncbi:N-acetylmuramoyl-L-alanine amidase [Wenzhouxiangella limi]|uniref:N-acetylmuramoyl-L-alanine amidase n=1 Tax=Wenzhouxiangella limi TaxID=2707351 RepID=UPI0019415AB2
MNATSAWLEGVDHKPLSYWKRLQARAPEEIELAVIHATELPDLAAAREYGERIHYPVSQTGNSGHFYIDRDGHVEQWVALDRVAHHVAGHNRSSIGIELINLGRFPDWFNSDHQAWREAITPAQIAALIDLLNRLMEHIPTLDGIAGHDQLDVRFVPASDDPNLQVRRKLDPGPDFPWRTVSEATGLSALGRP